MTNKHSVFSLHENKYDTDVQTDAKSTFLCASLHVHTRTHAYRVFEEHQIAQV